MIVNRPLLHWNAPPSVEGRRRLVERCKSRPIAHVAAEMGISRACVSKWVNRYRRYGELGLHDRSSAPRRRPTATPDEVVGQIEQLRRQHMWSAARITFKLAAQGTRISRRTIARHLEQLGLSRRRFIDPDGDSNRTAQQIIAHRPGHMVHIDVKKAGRIDTTESSPRNSSTPRAGGPSNNSDALRVWNIHDNYHRPHGAAGDRPPAVRLPLTVTNVLSSYS
ncbi:helix-turn-helix domain-containing protein [Streptomyces sp. NPDC058685]|uniref:helix-turn-helix domain-containing protein n=1 Tax=Streptomyces sp. NPDC058685 TaxID=3346598 RepID=UPI0036492B79